jgi:hypothetical protein
LLPFYGIASSKHTNCKPIFVHVGDTKDVYLYLSQKASAAEASWFKVVNWTIIKNPVGLCE